MVLLKLVLLIIYHALPIVLSNEETKSVITLTVDNMDNVLKSHDVVLLNFHAPWCGYSVQFMPVFETIGKTLRDKYNTKPKAVAGAVNGVDQHNLENKYEITKYPTVKLCLHGRVLTKEYRGARSLESLMKYVEDHLHDPLVELKNPDDWGKIYSNTPAVIAHIQRPNERVHETFQIVAKWLRGVCSLYVTYDGLHLPASTDSTKDRIYFKAEDQDFLQSNEFTGNSTNPEEVYKWVHDRCRSTISELTFENAEELTEAGIPFLLLLRDKSDYKSLERFKSAVKRELAEHVHISVRVLEADGNVFQHPLHQLGKTTKDLPIVMLDSFVHSYLFKNFGDLEVPGKLKEFVIDLNSGKLHLLHHVDELQTAISNSPVLNQVKPDVTRDKEEDDDDDYYEDNDRDKDDGDLNSSNNAKIESSSKVGEVKIDGDDTTTTLISESTFKKLKPSPYRYTFKQDEL